MIVTILWIVLSIFAFILGGIIGSSARQHAIESSGYAIIRLKDGKYLVVDLHNEIEEAQKK